MAHPKDAPSQHHQAGIWARDRAALEEIVGKSVRVSTNMDEEVPIWR